MGDYTCADLRDACLKISAIYEDLLLALEQRGAINYATLKKTGIRFEVQQVVDLSRKIRSAVIVQLED